MRRRNVDEGKKNGDGKKAKGQKREESQKSRGRSLLWMLVCVLLVIMYLVIPLLLLVIPGLATKLIFLSFIRYPVFVDFHSPGTYNLTGTQNLYLTAEDGVNIGVWQVLPHSWASKLKGDPSDNVEFFEEALGDDKPVVLYFHGNSGTRATCHRVLLYKLLSSLDVHVIAVDYRGFGDSGGTATPDKIHHDMETVYEWAKKRTKTSKIYVWGHSLGTGTPFNIKKTLRTKRNHWLFYSAFPRMIKKKRLGHQGFRNQHRRQCMDIISSVFVAKLCKSGRCPTGLILESPFNNLLDEVEFHPFGAPWWIIPAYSPLIRYAFKEGAEFFQSDENIDKITCPIMILHAKDDIVVPYSLGEKLYQVGLEKRPKEALPIKFVSFESERNLGHKYIVNADEMSTVVSEFIKK